MLYIKKIKLKNIRKHENLTINFDNSSTTHLFIGKNGDGKTSVLRSVALGPCNESDATLLLRKVGGRFIHHGCRKGSITVELFDSQGKDKYSIQTKIDETEGFEKISKTFKKNGKAIKSVMFPWDKIFITGYGSMARTLATKDYREYSAFEAVDGLFDYEASLQNPELIIRRVFPNGMPESMHTGLKKVLGLGEKDKIILNADGMFIKNGGAKEIELSAIGDGFQSTLTWILDMVHWWILKQKNGRKRTPSNSIKITNIKGIVLVDEIENHLHPEWEKRIITSLSNIFPGIQFIMSTHSPLVISGGAANTYDLHYGEDSISPKNVYGWKAENVFTEVMGLDGGSRAEEVEKILKQYDTLFLKELNETATKTEVAKLKKLEKQIRERTSGEEAILLFSKMDALKKFLKNSQARGSKR